LLPDPFEDEVFGRFVRDGRGRAWSLSSSESPLRRRPQRPAHRAYAIVWIDFPLGE